MTLDSRYQKIAYLEQLRDLLSTLYGVKDERSNEYRAHKHRLDGFIHAGLHIKLATHEELQEVVESEHIQAFGMGVNSEGLILDALTGLLAKTGLSMINLPTSGLIPNCGDV